jgi:hypothetical protein
MRTQVLAKDKKYAWTNHILQKMCFYRLSESRVRRILRNPKRIEEGIAPNTVASMQPSGSKRKTLRQAQGKEEIWVMWQKKNENNKKLILISAWRYPGTSPVGKPIKIPEDILEDLRNSGLIE